MSLSIEARARLKAQQSALVNALMTGGAVPAGFEVSCLRTAALSLTRKRARAMAHAWPTLAQELGDRFHERFSVYAQANALPRDGGPRADGRAFVRWLQAKGELPEAVRVHALAVDLRYASTRHGLVPRKWPVVRVALLGRPRRLVVAMRLPWFGELWWRFPR